jgi:hypothetical protein
VALVVVFVGDFITEWMMDGRIEIGVWADGVYESLRWGSRVRADKVDEGGSAGVGREALEELDVLNKSEQEHFIRCFYETDEGIAYQRLGSIITVGILIGAVGVDVFRHDLERVTLIVVEGTSGAQLFWQRTDLGSGIIGRSGRISESGSISGNGRISESRRISGVGVVIVAVVVVIAIPIAIVPDDYSGGRDDENKKYEVRTHGYRMRVGG